MIRAKAQLMYEKLERTVREYNPGADFKQIRAAYEFAEKAHGDQLRKDGSPYITHPLAVAQIVAEELRLAISESTFTVVGPREALGELDLDDVLEL